MTRTRTATLIAAALLMCATAAPAQAQDDLPPLPPLPKPSDKAAFDLIVEGEGTADKTVIGSGNNGICDISTNTASRQRFEYGRGKGVKVVFSKFKFPGQDPIVLIKRPGQKDGAEFTVVGSYDSSAGGSAKRSGNPASCVPADEEVGDEKECGPSGVQRTDIKLNSNFEGELVLDAADPLPDITGLGCGSNGVETLSGSPLFGWPSFKPLDPAPIPIAKVFGKKKKFKVDFEAPPQNVETENVVGSFVVRAVDMGDHTAVARFIRETKGGGKK